VLFVRNPKTSYCSLVVPINQNSTSVALIVANSDTDDVIGINTITTTRSERG
jgi:hypothetical protein